MIFRVAAPARSVGEGGPPHAFGARFVLGAASRYGRSRAACRCPCACNGSRTEIRPVARRAFSSALSIPARRWLALPQPDDPVHVFRLAAEIPEPRHALAAVVLRVH